jgi:hypothetical protein
MEAATSAALLELAAPEAGTAAKSAAGVALPATVRAQERPSNRLGPGPAAGEVAGGRARVPEPQRRTCRAATADRGGQRVDRAFAALGGARIEAENRAWCGGADVAGDYDEICAHGTHRTTPPLTASLGGFRRVFDYANTRRIAPGVFPARANANHSVAATLPIPSPTRQDERTTHSVRVPRLSSFPLRGIRCPPPVPRI